MLGPLRITSGCQKLQLPSVRKKFWAWNWITGLLFRAWYSGAYCGFSAPTRLNEILEQDLKIKKYHEVVDEALAGAILRPFGGEHTPRSCMLTSVAEVLHRTHRKCGVHKEMEGWMTTSSSDDDEDNESGDEWLPTSEDAASFNSKTMHRVSLSSSCSSHKERDCQELKRQQRS